MKSMKQNLKFMIAVFFFYLFLPLSAFVLRDGVLLSHRQTFESGPHGCSCGSCYI